MNIDVCNGDADGLCAVVQWRLQYPEPASLVTGLKRDIELLKHVQAHPGDQVLVCDIALRRNRAPLQQLLDQGVAVRYFDHHSAGEIPVHPLLSAHIDTASNTCTSLLINHHLSQAFAPWAVVGAFGDNLGPQATRVAQQCGLSSADTARLQTLGEALNYNAYGHSEEDVFISPARLYAQLARYDHPLDFWAKESTGPALAAMRADDMALATALVPCHQTARVRIYQLPDAHWSRRVSGSFGNHLAAAQPAWAHALLTPSTAGTWVVSVRAPLVNPVGAAAFCERFGGDGRAAAAGIDDLPNDQLQPFMEAFAATPWGDVVPAPPPSQG